ncbi:DUF4097 family beta strand repeat-containing protein [Longispora albida]|uniref:DUF4097 family beta strand repeat-containing protein n=1 Tax=Longispora albida TaxID=203523 RepID=UPI000378B76A|nr:DUF4097 family beta strand repeat-containing protein [Longispora albida]
MFQTPVYEFPAAGPVDAKIRVRAGSLTVHAEDRPDVHVTVKPRENNEACQEAAAQTKVHFSGSALVIETPESAKKITFGFNRSKNLDIVVRMPLDGQVNVKTASADAELLGRYASVNVDAASGDLRVEECTGDVVIDTASGDVHAQQIGGDLRMKSASGDLRTGRVTGDVRANAASGDITLGEISGSVEVDTASGDVKIAAVGASAKVGTASGEIGIGRISNGRARFTTASGDIKVGVVAGTSVWLDLSTMSGRTRSDLAMGQTPVEPTGAQLTLEARSASGEITVYRAE